MSDSHSDDEIATGCAVLLCMSVMVLSAALAVGLLVGAWAGWAVLAAACFLGCVRLSRRPG